MSEPPERDRSLLLQPDRDNDVEVSVWNAVCFAMTGNIITRQYSHIVGVIEKLQNVEWRSKMRPAFVEGILAAAVPDLEDVTFVEEGSVAVPLEDIIPEYDTFEVNLALDRMKAQNARALASALRGHLSPRKV